MSSLNTENIKKYMSLQQKISEIDRKIIQIREGRESSKDNLKKEVKNRSINSLYISSKYKQTHNHNHNLENSKTLRLSIDIERVYKEEEAKRFVEKIRNEKKKRENRVLSKKLKEHFNLKDEIESRNEFSLIFKERKEMERETMKKNEDGSCLYGSNNKSKSRFQYGNMMKGVDYHRNKNMNKNNYMNLIIEEEVLSIEERDRIILDIKKKYMNEINDYF